MKKTFVFYLIALISTSLFLILQLYDPPIIREHLEGKAFDLRLWLRNVIKHQPARDDIVIVYVDEKSIREIGRWPWRRDVMAGLVNRVSEGGPKVIGIDIMFSEEESRETDEVLAKAIRIAIGDGFILLKKRDFPFGIKRYSLYPRWLIAGFRFDMPDELN